MKACSDYKQDVALLAAESLDGPNECLVRQHLERCEECRSYYEEICFAATKLKSIETRTGIQSSERFHQRVMDTIKGEKGLAPWHPLSGALWASLLHWRVAVPAATLALLAILALSLQFHNTHLQVSPPPKLVTLANHDPEPTISNYQTVANHSLEKLDELLSRQGTHSLPSTPIYTASSLAQFGGLE